MKNHLRSTILILTIFCTIIACKPDPAETVVSGKIWTGNPEMPFAESMAIKDGKILDIGTKDQITKYIGEKTGVFDHPEGLITPGFIDSHVHFLTGGFRLSSVQLRDAQTPEEFVNRIQEYAATVPAGTWIMGGDWDHENWGGILPSREWIDSVTADHPVWITRLDGHMSLANSKALELVGIDRSIQNVEGGMIVRNENGELTGIFKDNAAFLVEENIPERSAADKDRALQAAMRYVAENGVTTVHDVSADPEIYQRAMQNNELKTRIYAITFLSKWQLLNDYIKDNGRGNEWLYFGGLKGFVDGSLGSHTAAFFKPYSDLPADSGLLLNPEKDLYKWISSADSAGLQVMIHAIGDRAINTLLNIYERVATENGPRDRRFRIEHAQHIAPQDISRFAELDVIPSMQPYHAIDDGRWAEKLIGPERIKTTYAFKSLFDSGAQPAFGSDWFVAPPLPLEGIYAAVTRRTLDDQNPTGWVPEQKISVEQALTAYTRNASRAGFSETRTGMLATQMLADFVVIDRDLFSIEAEEIRDAQILETWIDGKPVFTRE
ncbi:amidohydrolase [Fulvivirga sedimenti]|uniref:Amidohydrolase n=1 Tax=Fulvivirga sedimenti TaxID=2879465 RepID=A0A9X1KUQ0_9BACT|nr:amidohydrolase [Fulvivirga sedimenti]MCA6073743.1 amidohydrolase [Fulvivirga sedimenti]